MESAQQRREKYPIFDTIEEIIAYTQANSSSDQILIQEAEGGSLTIGEFISDLGRICNMFLDLGMKRDRNVGVFLPNCMEYSYLYIALGRLGIPVIPINRFLKGESLKYVLNHCDVHYLVTSKELFEEDIDQFGDSLETLRHIIYIDEQVLNQSFGESSFFSDFRRYPSDFTPPWVIEGNEIQGVWMTSGTTGLPKGIVATHKYLLQRLSFTANYFRLEPSDVIYFALPMYHQPFFNWGITMALMGGCKLVFVERFTASRFWEHISKYKGTLVYTTGTIIPILLKQPSGPFETEGREFIRLWMPWPLDPGAIERWPMIKFLEGYGLSEYAIAAFNSYHNPEIGSQGPITPFTDLKICDPETSAELPNGKIGEIVVRSKLGPDYMMQGYYNSPEETERVIRDGWFYTGDAGYLDDDSLLHFSDRLKDSVRVGGENVPSLQVEAIIRKYPKIEDVAIVGVKGDLGHDEILAHVVVKEGEKLSPDEFFAFCNQDMAYYMVPMFLYIRDDLPKTATLRVQKYKLRDEGIPPGTVKRKDTRGSKNRKK
ncbi:AMP-binding protein [Thermodesulfobacteriota bacterium]